MNHRSDTTRVADARSSGPPAVQLTLNLSYRPALGRDSFLVTSANEAAVTWIDSWPNWPSSALVLCGPACCGKTHLGSVWQARTGAVHVDAAELNARHVPKLLAAKSEIVVEAAERAEEEPLLHLLNGVWEQKNHLLLTAIAPPSRWQTKLRDLSSRLRALPVALIEPPDDMLLQAMLMKRFADQGLAVAADVTAYLAGQMERSFAAAEHLVAKIDKAALTEGRAVTLPFVRDVLRRAMPEDDATIQQDRC